jgi:hypothetical protein
LKITNSEIKLIICPTAGLIYRKIFLPPRDVGLDDRREWGDLGEAIYEAMQEEPELIAQINKSLKKYRKNKK